MDQKIRQPTWNRPSAPGARPKLVVYNSLTRKKEEFTPISANRVLWYSCGPTVYDSAHMGHARNYVSVDINRRLLQDYFGYPILFVQNVTDIDDKIIVRARERYLFAEYAQRLRAAGTVSSDNKDEVRRAVDSYAQAAFGKLAAQPDQDSLKTSQGFQTWVSGNQQALAPTDPKFNLNSVAVLSALQGIESAQLDEFLEKVESVMVRSLDKEKGATVTDHGVFREISSHFEADFDSDMAKLNVRAPTVTTRVSEYVDEIVVFVEQIISRGYAYAADDGSVYFDVAAFEKSPHHDYAKLQPWNKGVQDLIDEGEGTLSLKGSGKRSRSDFALWKSSKPGEPAWDSPWGRGRPGWHIECSVMASHVLGPQIDIHTGGIDLAFPHHDNEMAQSEACFDCPQWVNYFLHTGHLHIEGQKMSKSLKNFISIKEALEKFSARQLRLAIALQQWNTPLDFKMSLSPVKAFESTLSTFFNKTKALAREATKVTSKKVGAPELELFDSLTQTQKAVDEAFCDNFSVPQALQSISNLVQQANEYIARVESPKIEPLVEVAHWVTSILRVIGLETRDIGWAEQEDGAGASVEDVALPFVQLFSRFRDRVRQKGIAVKDEDLLALCDEVRDIDLFDLGVVIDDRKGDQAALVKFVSESQKAEILNQREILEQKARVKAEQAEKLQQKEAERAERAKVPPTELFKGDANYSDFDERGIPQKDAQGTPLSKSSIKKLQKLWIQQEKLHNEYK